MELISYKKVGMEIKIIETKYSSSDDLLEEFEELIGTGLFELMDENIEELKKIGIKDIRKEFDCKEARIFAWFDEEDTLAYVGLLP